MKIKTNSLGPDEPKDPDACTLFSIYRAFVTEDRAREMADRYRRGIAWGAMKTELFETINGILKEPRSAYEELMKNPGDIDRILKKGALRAREYAVPFLAEVRKAVGIESIG